MTDCETSESINDSEKGADPPYQNCESSSSVTSPTHMEFCISEDQNMARSEPTVSTDKTLVSVE